MENYLKEFNTHSEYETFKAGTDFIRPNVSICNQEDDVHYNGHDYSKDYLTFKALEDGTFSFSTNNIQYSTNYGTTWATLTAGTSTPTINAGDKIMWKTSGLTPTSSAGIGKFSSTGKFDVEGNVMSLVGGDNFIETATMSNYQFFKLFNACINLISAKHLILPATTLANNCYRSMFSDCISLVITPELPATELTTYCYQNMFSGCTNLTIAPELPATTLAMYCYSHMFEKCTALEIAPELPATTLELLCYYYMFSDCISLTTAPKLPATTLENACYEGMFSGCISLIIAPELPATTLKNECYESMFQNCIRLNLVTCLATDITAFACTRNWLSGVASTGTFVKNASMAGWTSDADGIPTGWTIVDASA